MKNVIASFLAAISVMQFAQAQGTVYISNLDQTSARNNPVGSDSWYAADFYTGNNADGYTLDSIELAMTAAIGSPSSFTVMLYSMVGSRAPFPGSYLVALHGSPNPSTTAIFAYTSGSTYLLSPNTGYFMVLTSGTTIANGAYNWSNVSAISYQTGGWLNDSGIYYSSNGSSWAIAGGSDWNAQFAVTATAIPEPSSLVLFGLSSGIFIYVCRKFQRH